METNGFDMEMIEAYIQGKLSPSDKLKFEETLQKDPLIKNEYLMQKEVITSIQNFRKQELKARLNKVEVPSTNYNYLKIAAAALLLIGSGIAGYFYLNQDQTKLEVQNISADKPIVSTVTPTDNNTEINTTVEGVSDQTIISENTTKNMYAETETTKKTLKKKSSRQEVATPEIPDMDVDGGNFDKSVNLPESTNNLSSDSKSKRPEVTITSNSGTLSYQYYDNKLFLNGNFNSAPYELIELNSHKQRQLYMFFNGNYYQLNSGTVKVTELKKIKDASLKKQLEALRVK